MTTMTLTAALTAAVVLSAPCAQAETLYVEKIVSVRDVNFRNPAEAAKVYARLKSASKEVCDSRRFGAATPGHSEALCRRDALSQAVRDLKQPAVARIHHMPPVARDTYMASMFTPQVGGR